MKLQNTDRTQLFGRIALLLLGLFIIAAGVAVFSKADLGYDPFMVFDNGVSKLLGLSLGLTHVSINLALLVIYLLCRKRRYINIGTVLALTVTGPSIDGLTWLMGLMVPGSLSLPARLVMTAASCCLVGLGVYLYTGVRLGAGPNDLLSVILSDLLKKPLGPVRIAVDALWLLAGVLLGGKAGPGTVFSLVLVGASVQLWTRLRLFSRYIRRD